MACDAATTGDICGTSGKEGSHFVWSHCNRHWPLHVNVAKFTPHKSQIYSLAGSNAFAASILNAIGTVASFMTCSRNARGSLKPVAGE